MTRAIPYPGDVRAKGWRFELDHEKIEQSDTWALASAELKPWLLMLWLTAWKQTPCGSMPDSDELIAARIGMPLKTFVKHRTTLRRGWWQADDGRLYHDTIVLFVVDMMTRRRKESDRKALARGKIPPEVPPLSHGTTTGVRPDSDTGTGTGTSNTVIGSPPELTRGSLAGEVCKAIKAKGITGVNPSHPELLAFIEQGVPLETFEAAAQTCSKATPPKGLSYLLAIVKRQMGDAATIATGAGMPTAAWDASRASIEAKGIALGLGKWNDADMSASREQFPAYLLRVRAAVEGVPA